MGTDSKSSATDGDPAPPNGRGASGRSGRWWPRASAVDASLPIDPDLDQRDPAEPSRQHRPGVRWPGRYAPGVLVAVFVGGALGTLARYELERALPAPAGAFPVATFVVNTSGALLIGVLMSVLAGWPTWHRRVRPFAGVGVLGGWTTMSTLAVEADLLGKAGALAAAAGYVSASLVAGVTAVALGMAAGRRWRGPAGVTALASRSGVEPAGTEATTGASGRTGFSAASAAAGAEGRQ